MVKETVKHIIQQFYVLAALDPLGECHVILLICFYTYYELIPKFFHQCQSCKAGEVNPVN